MMNRIIISTIRNKSSRLSSELTNMPYATRAISILLLYSVIAHQQSATRTVDLICQLKDELQNTKAAIENSHVGIESSSQYSQQGADSNQQQLFNSPDALEFTLPNTNQQISCIPNIYGQNEDEEESMYDNELDEQQQMQLTGQPMQLPLQKNAAESNDYEFIATIQSVNKGQDHNMYSNSNPPGNSQTTLPYQMDKMYKLPMPSAMLEAPSQSLPQSYVSGDAEYSFINNPNVQQYEHQQQNRPTQFQTKPAFDQSLTSDPASSINPSSLAYIQNFFKSVENTLNKLYALTIANKNAAPMQHPPQQNNENFEAQYKFMQMPSKIQQNQVQQQFPANPMYSSTTGQQQIPQQLPANIMYSSANGQHQVPQSMYSDIGNSPFLQPMKHMPVNTPVQYKFAQGQQSKSGIPLTCPFALPPDIYENKLKKEQNQYFTEYKIPQNWIKYGCMKEACMKESGMKPNEIKGHSVSDSYQVGPMIPQGFRGPICD
ncbi:hypothetical protein GJ496_004458 [Pomphorhynchus laevis]|nr:hypothetical protein GJ496_004458 [Pomphorhynchus laevis]